MTVIFDQSVRVAAASAARTDVDDAGTSLVNQVLSLNSAAEPLAMDNYRLAYEAEPAEFFGRVTSGIDSLYQHLHATVASAARLVGERADPSLAVRTLAGLEQNLLDAPTHPLAIAMRPIRREVALLRWLSTVRNKAVQHRAEEGYVANRAIVFESGVALLRKPGPPAAEDVRKAKALLRGLIRKYGLQLDPGEGGYEALAYLDFVAHALYRIDAADFDAARRVIEPAAVHNLILSRDLLDNTDLALAELVALVPPNADSPFKR